MPSLVASGGMLIGISTPYRRMGLLHAKYRDHFGVAGDDVLVVQGDSATFHLALSAALIEAHKSSDPEAAVSEALVEKLMAEINRIANKPCPLPSVSNGSPRLKLRLTDSSAPRRPSSWLRVRHASEAAHHGVVLGVKPLEARGIRAA